MQFRIIRIKNQDSSLSNLRRSDGMLEKQRKHKKARMDELNEGASDGEMIVTKTEINEFGDQTCQTNQGTSTYGDTTIDYVKSHHRMSYEDAGPSSVQAHSEQWLDDKHFMTPQGQNTNSNTNSSNASSNDESDQQRCKTKNYKALEPCSCPLCARVYSNVSNLRQHMRLIHNPTSVCCPLCQKSFTSDLYLKRHYLSMHGSTIPAQANAQQNNQNASQLQSTPTTQQGQATQSQVKFKRFEYFKNFGYSFFK